MASQKIKQANIFGRIGTGIGQGLAEQVPKEIERSRLASGLQRFAQESRGKSPLENLASLSAIPGAVERPQLLQSFSDLARSQTQADALKNFNQPQQQYRPEKFPQIGRQMQPQAAGSEIPSITREEPLARLQKGYIPPTQEQIYGRAGELYNQNPALFDYVPQNAIKAAESEASREKDIAEAYKGIHGDLSDLQDNVISRLKKQSIDLGVDIPGDVYSDIEDKAIQATKPKSEGGQGLTEQQAMKEYGKELDDVSRQYQQVKNLGGLGLLSQHGKETLRSLESLRKKFEKSGDTRNFADYMISNLKISPQLAYSIAEPIKTVPELNKTMSELPDLYKSKGIDTGFMTVVPEDVKMKETKKIMAQTAKSMGQKGSPLAIANELEKKGYDSSEFLKYLDENREKYNLTTLQIDQLGKSRSWISPLGDWWFTSFSGVEE